MAVITLENVSKSYGKTKAVDNLNLTVNEGEIFGFIGPNGAGKSTTIRMMMNLLSCNSGKISVMGLNPANHDIEIKKQVGYVPADTFMYNDMKVKDLFRFSESFHKIKAGRRISQLVDILDIETNKSFEELSFGNRKKVSIACALIHSPRLLILDEPSNGLDPVIRMNLYSLLQEEQKNGVSIFFSSHVLHEVQKFCHKIGLIKEGRLIKESTSADFTNIGYRQVSIETPDNVDFSSLDGVAGFTRDASSCRFMYSGNLNHLIKLLSTIDVKSVHIEEPELENVFLHYFQ
ncbi:MAG: ABC transporter ATP-binding protein [Bacteroidales bacterium]|nr:ABC transporter ATP-binding protein [Bacteroidales bacterium]HQP03873.1 ABC transporter ATP-binding protein [Bacteroidales bacterium]